MSTELVTGFATTTIAAPIIAAITDVTRVGDWGPECVACRWVGDAAGPVVGTKFEGDNVAAVVTKSFSYPPHASWQKFVYRRLPNRSKGMATGMQATLDRIEAPLDH